MPCPSPMTSTGMGRTFSACISTISSKVRSRSSPTSSANAIAIRNRPRSGCLAAAFSGKQGSQRAQGLMRIIRGQERATLFGVGGAAGCDRLIGIGGQMLPGMTHALLAAEQGQQALVVFLRDRMLLCCAQLRHLASGECVTHRADKPGPPQSRASDHDEIRARALKACLGIGDAMNVAIGNEREITGFAHGLNRAPVGDALVELLPG